MTADRHMGNSLNEGPFLKDAVISGRPKRDPNLENYPYAELKLAEADKPATSQLLEI